MDIWYLSWSEIKDKYEGVSSLSSQDDQKSQAPESSGTGASSNRSAGSSSLTEEAMEEEGTTGTVLTTESASHAEEPMKEDDLASTGTVTPSVALAESSLSLSSGEVSGSGDSNSEGETDAKNPESDQQQPQQSDGSDAADSAPTSEDALGARETEQGAQNDAAGNDGSQPKSDSEASSGEPALTAQANTTKRMIPKANSRRVGDHEYQNIVLGSSIKERGPELGLVPEQDVRLMSGVLSDTRSKVVTIRGTTAFGRPDYFTFLFRLGTVDFGSDGTRSRVMFSLLDAKHGANNYNHYIDFAYSKEKRGLSWKPGYDEYRPGFNSFTFVTKSDTKRADYFDYDFDMYVENLKGRRGDTVACLHLVIISGNDRSSVAGVLTNPVITYLRYIILINRGNMLANENVINVSGWANFARTVQIGDLFSKTQVLKDYPAHSITCPKINAITDTPADERRNPIEGPASSSLMITFLDRAAKSPEEVLSNDPSRVGIYMGVMFAGLGTTQSLTIVKADDLCRDTRITDCTVREMTCSGRLSTLEGNTLKNKHLVMFKGGKKSEYFFLEAHANVRHKGSKKMVRNPKYNEGDSRQSPQDEYIIVGTDDYYAPEIVSIKRYQVGDDVVLPKLIDWPGHEEYLTSSEGRLQQVWWEDVDTDNPTLKSADAGPSGFEITGFGVDPTGNFIYYPSSREGVPGYDAASEGQLNESGEYIEPEFKESDAVADYRIMACKLHGGRFSEPFVFAELDHPVDLVELVSSTPACMAFVATSVVDGMSGKGDIWYTAMPNVRSITVLACEALGEYVFPGEKAVLKVSVRNDGNTYLSGFTARMRDLTAGTTGSEEVRVTFDAATLMQSAFNPLVEGSTIGELQNVEPDYSLAPGKSAVYQVEFTVPNDWKGTKKVTVLASDATVADSDRGIVAASEDLLTAMSEDGYGDDLYAQAEEVYAYDFEWPDEEAPYDNLDVIEFEDEPFYDAPIQVPTDGGGVANADGSQGTEGGTGAATGVTRQATPRTADGLTLGPVATVAGAAGAAMIAYSRRRARIEKELRNRGIDLDD